MSLLSNRPNSFFESVALLSCLQPVPGEPGKNTASSDFRINSTGCGTRTISLDRESALCSDFVYLSIVSDDPTKVTAVCLEESQGDKSRGIKIRLASNTGNLQEVQSGLARICDILAELCRSSVGNEPPKSTSLLLWQDRLLLEIVTHVGSRILQRLWSKHAPPSKKHNGNQKPPLIPRFLELLQLATRCKHVDPSSAAVLYQLQAVRLNLHDLHQKFERTPKSRPRADLRDQIIEIVRVAAQLPAEHQLLTLFRGIPISQRWPVSAKESVVRSLGKIGRYYTVCQDLIRAATRLTCFQTIVVQVVPRPPALQPTAQPGHSGASVDSICKRLSIDDTQRTKQVIAARNKVEVTKVQDLLNQKLDAITGHCKVHAEIQLALFYLRQDQGGLMPRVVAASKSACFLCDLFLQHYKFLYVSRTHGKLYEKWTTPPLRSLNLKAPQLSQLRAILQAMELKIRKLIVSSLVQNHKPGLYDGNESVVWTIPSWTSASTESHQISTPKYLQEVEHDVSLPSEDESTSAGITTPTPQGNFSLILAEPVPENCPSVERNLQGAALLCLHSQETTPKPNSLEMANIFHELKSSQEPVRIGHCDGVESLIPGEWLCMEMGGSESLHIVFENVEFFISCELSLEERLGENKVCWARIQCTPYTIPEPEEVDLVLDEQIIHHDQHTIYTGAAHSNRDMYVVSGKWLFKIKFACLNPQQIQHV